MTSDRSHSQTFHITHEFLAFMLGVRRVGITKAASALQRRQAHRLFAREVSILDRAGLEPRRAAATAPTSTPTTSCSGRREETTAITASSRPGMPALA